MAKVLVVGGLIQCSHGGTVKLLQGDPRLTIASSAAITFGMESGLSFVPGAPGVVVPCPNPGPVNPAPCTATLPATAGVSTLLTVGNLGVLLDSAQGQTVNPVAPATWSVASAGQAIVSVKN
jgi:hypothetical protein